MPFFCSSHGLLARKSDCVQKMPDGTGAVLYLVCFCDERGDARERPEFRPVPCRARPLQDALRNIFLLCRSQLGRVSLMARLQGTVLPSRSPLASSGGRYAEMLFNEICRLSLIKISTCLQPTLLELFHGESPVRVVSGHIPMIPENPEQGEGVE